MIPIRDDVIRKRVPIVTWLIIGINCYFFIRQLGLHPILLQRSYFEFGLIPATLLQRGGSGFSNFFTYQFIHGSWGHLLGNMWILALFGDNVEDRMGRLPFLFFYLLAGVGAGICHWLFNLRSLVPTIGASGSIAGIMAAYLFLFPFARVKTVIPVIIIPYFVTVPSFLYIGIWFIIQLYYGAMAWGGQDLGGVAWWAHIGGFIFGGIFYRFFVNPQLNQGERE